MSPSFDETQQHPEAMPTPPILASKGRVTIISGLSGSGKSTAMRALEDVGFFCIDNMPVPLLPKVLELAASQAGPGRLPRPYAFVVDTREREFLSEAVGVLDLMEAEGVAVQVIFLDAEDDVLVRRYSETRRRHPMSDGGTVREGIERERQALVALKARANATLDTSRHTVHTLKAMIQQLVEEDAQDHLHVNILSFGFKYGLPSECDLVFDVRFVPNPYFVEHLKPHTGLKKDVADYVLSFPEVTRFLELFGQFAEFMLPLYEQEGKSYLTIGIGCTGGKHRSVAISEVLATTLREQGHRVETRHRDRLKTNSP